MKKLLILLLSVIMIFSLSSCQKTEQIPTEIIETFDTVEEFKIAIKKDPHKYTDKRISVTGYANTLFKGYSSAYKVFLFDNLPADDELLDDRVRIEIVITDNVKLAVLEDGDFIKLDGIVTFSYDGNIYLNHCTYTMIKTNEEQKTK